jgi:hypothetical protein
MAGSKGEFFKRGRRVVALGFVQLVALVGIVGVAVILAAILVSDAKVQAWAAGLIIGIVCVALTLLVLFSGRHARRR